MHAMEQTKNLQPSFTVSKELQSGAFYKYSQLLQIPQRGEFRSFCPLCNETNSQTCKGLARHFLTKHHNKKEYGYECIVCKFLFEKNEEVVKHLAEDHGCFYMVNNDLFYRIEDLLNYCTRRKIPIPQSVSNQLLSIPVSNCNFLSLPLPYQQPQEIYSTNFVPIVIPTFEQNPYIIAGFLQTLDKN